MTLAQLIYSAASSFDPDYQVYPVFAPQEVDPPWITYRINQTSEQDEISYQLGGDMNPYWATFYVTIWTKDYSVTDSLVQPLIAHMHAIRGDGYSSFQRVQFMGREDLGDPELILFGADIKFRGYTAEV